MTEIEKIRARISRKGVRAEDIKRQGLLTEDEIAYLPVEKVYAWCRNGDWKQKDFNKWLKVLRVVE